MPSSVTLHLTAAPMPCTKIRTFPPGFEYLTAFDNKLKMTCSTRFLSAVTGSSYPVSISNRHFCFWCSNSLTSSLIQSLNKKRVLLRRSLPAWILFILSCLFLIDASLLTCLLARLTIGMDLLSSTPVRPDRSRLCKAAFMLVIGVRNSCAAMPRNSSFFSLDTRTASSAILCSCIFVLEPTYIETRPSSSLQAHTLVRCHWYTPSYLRKRCSISMSEPFLMVSCQAARAVSNSSGCKHSQALILSFSISSSRR